MPPSFLGDPLALVPGRVATFKKWPYTRPKDKCVPQNLANAGFYHRPDVSEDSVQCFVCHKFFHGWAPDVSSKCNQMVASPAMYLECLVRSFVSFVFDTV